MSKKKTISYSVEPKIKKQIDHYARVKGFVTASAMSRIAIMAYMSRTPLKKCDMANDDED